jgi:hypothetical protein
MFSLFAVFRDVFLILEWHQRFFVQTDRTFRILRLSRIRPHNRSIPNNRKHCKSKTGTFKEKIVFLGKNTEHIFGEPELHAKINKVGKMDSFAVLDFTFSNGA